jgi:hypothetical protein
LRAAIEQILGRGFAAEGDEGIGLGKNIDQKRGDLLGTVAFLCGRLSRLLYAMVLPQGESRKCSETDEGGPDCEGSQGMTAHELGGVIAPVSVACEHRKTLKMPADVVGKRLHRQVAAIRFLAHGLGDDGIQVTAEPRPQPERRQAAPIRDAAAVAVAFVA